MCVKRWNRILEKFISAIVPDQVTRGMADKQVDRSVERRVTCIFNAIAMVCNLVQP